MPCRTGENLNKFSNVRTAPKWSFRGRVQGGGGGGGYETRQANPGPGAYTTSSFDTGKKRAASWGFGSAATGRGGARGDSVGAVARPSSAPGPGQYSHEGYRMTRSGTPSFGFGSSQRESKGYSNSSAEAYCSPGPGQYNGNYRVTRNAHPSYTSAPRRPMSAGNEQTPGPGSYQSARAARPDAPAAPKWKFGSSERAKTADSVAPGPGNYNYNATMGRGSPKYSMRGKHTHLDKKSVEAPGPGAFAGQYTQFDN